MNRVNIRTNAAKSGHQIFGHEEEMTAFISYSSKDDDFVSQVAKALGQTKHELDRRTFEYTLNTQAIRQALSRSSLYVLFLSKNSISSNFVAEEQRTALEMRAAGGIQRVLIISLDGTSYRMLPKWLQEINIVTTQSSPKACARRIQSLLIAIDAERDHKESVFVGRDEELASLRKALAGAPGKAPLAIHIVGHYGIGRRRFLQKSLADLFPRLSRPIPVTVSAFDGSEELYRQLYGLHVVGSLDDTINAFDDFRKKAIVEQVEAIASILEEMADNDEFISIADNNGVYDEYGNYQEHISALLTRLARSSRPMLSFIQTRMMPFKLREEYNRSYHTFINPLNSEQTKELLSFLLKDLAVDFSEQQLDELSKHLDGHPFNVNFAARFAHAYGIDALLIDPTELLEWKRRRAEDFLDRLEFSEAQKDILAILVEYSHLTVEIMLELLNIEGEVLGKALRTLEEFCCVERNQNYYKVSAPIVDAVRRDDRFKKTEEWRRNVAVTMCEAVSGYHGEDHIPVQLLENAVTAAAREGGGAAFLSNLILPSHLLRIARDHYDKGKRTPCMEFCERAFEMKDRLTVEGRIEVLRLWGLSAIRANDREKFDFVLRQLGSIPGRLAERIKLFLEGFDFRSRKLFDEAESKFLSAWKLAKRNQSINRELASLYCKQRRYADAELYARPAYEIAPTNPYIIDILVESILGKASMGLHIDGRELERLTSELKLYGDAPGSSFYLVRLAHRKFNARDYPGARETVERAIERTPNLISPYFLRAEISLAQGNTLSVERDIKKIEGLLEMMGGFSEGDEARLVELEIRHDTERGNFVAAKHKCDTTAFLSEIVKNRLYNQIKKAIGFNPETVDGKLRQWAKGGHSGASDVKRNK